MSPALERTNCSHKLNDLHALQREPIGVIANHFAINLKDIKVNLRRQDNFVQQVKIKQTNKKSSRLTFTVRLYQTN